MGRSLILLFAFVGLCWAHSEYLQGLLRMVRPSLRKGFHGNALAARLSGSEPFLQSVRNLTSSGETQECLTHRFSSLQSL